VALLIRVGIVAEKEIVFREKGPGCLREATAGGRNSQYQENEKRCAKSLLQNPPLKKMLVLLLI
jgi:hypothetical protein